MIVKLNMTFDEPTLNGHIYPEEELKNALEESISFRTLSVHSYINQNALKNASQVLEFKSPYNVIGWVSKVSYENGINLEVEMNPGEFAEAAEERANIYTIAAMGTLVDNVVTDIKLDHIFEVFEI